MLGDGHASSTQTTTSQSVGADSEKKPKNIRTKNPLRDSGALTIANLSDTPLLRAIEFLVSQRDQLGAIPPPF